MSTRAHVSACMVALALAAPPDLFAQERTARDVVDLIVRDSPHARAIHAAIDVTRGEQLARLAYPNPSVMYSREGAGFTEFLQVEQPLLLFGVRAALTRAGVAATAAAEAERDARLWTLRADAAVRVARLLAADARLALAGSHVQDVERLVGILAIREREGEGSRFDRLRAEEELAEARQTATAAAVARTEAHAALSALLPRDVTVSRVTGSMYSQDDASPPADLLTRAVSTRAELVALQRAADRAEFESDAARRSRRPSPSIFGGIKRADDEDGHATGGVFGLSVSVPLFDTGRLDAARWTAERARIDLERASMEHQIRSEIAGGLAVLTLRQAALQGDPGSSGDELAAIADVAYREGEIGILELLDAVRTAARARFRSLELQFEARLAQIAVERAVGDVLWP